jgi:hypothetical protein
MTKFLGDESERTKRRNTEKMGKKAIARQKR